MYPRVTEILNPFAQYHSVPKLILNKAAAKGTKVHALCAAIAKGAWLPESMIDEELQGYIRSFEAWATEVQEFTIIEQRYQHDEMKYTGQLDFVVKLHDDESYLVDLKTSSKPQKTYPVQMAAYHALLSKHGIEVKGALLVYLDKEGAYPDIHHINDFTNEFNTFTAALTCWNYFNGEKNARS